MEAEISVQPVGTPAPVASVAPPMVESAVAPAPAQQMSNGGVFEQLTKNPLSLADLLLIALLSTVSIYGIFYYRKAYKKLDEQPTADEFDNMNGDIQEVMYNVKKQLGKRYEKT